MRNSENRDNELCSKERNVVFDFIRAIAIILVVLCHAVERCFPVHELRGVEEELIFSTFFTLGRLGVPLFLFLTGALVLTKDFSTPVSITRFYRHNYLTLLVTVICWAGLYNVAFMPVRDISWSYIVESMAFMAVPPSSAWWYMPMIVSLYIIVPFLAQIVQSNSKKIMLPFLGVCVLILFFKPFRNMIVDKSFLGGVYGCYLMLGFYMSMVIGRSNWVRRLMPFVFLILLVVVISWIFHKVQRDHSGAALWYDVGRLLCCGSALFLFLGHVRIAAHVWLVKVTRLISVNSLGVYFVHTVVLDYACHWGWVPPLRQLPCGSGVIVMLVGSFCLSLAIVLLLKQIPLLRGLLLRFWPRKA